MWTHNTQAATEVFLFVHFNFWPHHHCQHRTSTASRFWFHKNWNYNKNKIIAANGLRFTVSCIFWFEDTRNTEIAFLAQLVRHRHRYFASCEPSCNWWQMHQSVILIAKVAESLAFRILWILKRLSHFAFNTSHAHWAGFEFLNSNRKGFTLKIALDPVPVVDVNELNRSKWIH